MVATHRSVALRLGCAAIIAAAIPATSAELKDPLSPLTLASRSILCFRRDYSPEHLEQHPKQTTRSVLLAFQEQGLVTIVLNQRTRAQNRILAVFFHGIGTPLWCGPLGGTRIRRLF
jgi:hypothetical protein